MSPDLYFILKSLHIISFVAWMAGLLYLPRLYVYHCMASKGGELDITLQVMERKLLRYIMNPAMIATFLFGLWLAFLTEAWQSGWFHAKFGLVLILAGFHGACAVWRKGFAAGTNRHGGKFYRIANEVPTVLLIGLVFLAVMKPF